MKAIEIKTEMKIYFLEACRLAGLEAEELKKINCPGYSYFKVAKTNISQNDIFKLGFYFSQLVSKRNTSGNESITQ